MTTATAASVLGGIGLPSMSGPAGMAAVGGAAWGKFATGYSRSLFLFDAGFRFERMNTGYEYANTQQEQFRKDLDMMTELTFRKMGIYTVVGTMGMAIFIAIFCAGRLGLHGPSPPVWIMGLFLTNIAMAFAFAGLGIWLAFHAMWRAKAACVHLSTRKIRLLIPTRKKLDTARKYGNQWEHQKFRDLLKLPYASEAVGWKWSGEVPDVSEDEDDSGSGSDGSGSGRARSAPPAGRRKKGNGMKRVPGWIQEEYEQDRVGIAGGSGNIGQRPDAAPEHFQLYAKAQKEWFTHDCYARVCMFYAFLSFFQGGSFYGLGQINIELRAWWVAFANNFIMMIIHFLMLKFDIVKTTNSDATERLPYCQYAGTLCIPIAAIGMALDFRVEYWTAAIYLTWVCIFICYLLQIVYALRLLELVMPSEIKREERTGGMIWPQDWKVPASFQHVYYFVSPPRRLQPEKGQIDVVRELKEGYYNKGSLGGSKDQDMVYTPPVMALEDDFEKMNNVAWPRLCPQSKDRVRQLHEKFRETQNSAAKQGGWNNGLKHDLGSIQNELHFIQKNECPDIPSTSASSGGGHSDGGSGSGSDSNGYSSGGSGGQSDHSGGYAGKDTARYHPDSPAYTKVSYAEPWRLVAIISGTFAFSWVFLFIGMIIDCAIGVQALVTAPHWAKPPMSRSSFYPWEYGTPIGLQRFYAGDIRWTPEELFWHENHKPRPEGWMPHWMSVGATDRRLANSADPLAPGLGKEGMKQAFNSLVSALPTADLARELLHRKPTEDEAAALTSLESRFRHARLGWNPTTFTWPGFFEPKMLACGRSQDGVHRALAITSRGVAVAASLGGGSETVRLMLTGLSDYPPLLAASWASGPKDGLMLVTKTGDLLHCPGAHNGGRWACGPLANAPPRVPIADGLRLASAASAWLGDASSPRLHVATVLESSPDMVALWALEGNTEAASWLPLGEIPVPSGMATGASLHFVNGDILIATKNGATIQRRISDGSVVTATSELSIDVEMRSKLHWQAACGLHGPNGGIAHLAMRQHGKITRPEVMVLRMTPIEV